MTTIGSKEKMGVVLVHGAFVDGSGWEGVYKILKKDGYEVSMVRSRPSHSRMTSQRRRAQLARMTVLLSWSDTRTAAS